MEKSERDAGMAHMTPIELANYWHRSWQDATCEVDRWKKSHAKLGKLAALLILMIETVALLTALFLIWRM